MRKPLAVGLALGLTATSVALAQPVYEDHLRVTNVDRNGQMFTAQSYANTATYRTTASTIIRAAGVPTSFSYIMAGQIVHVASHNEGNGRVADAVDVVYLNGTPGNLAPP